MTDTQQPPPPPPGPREAQPPAYPWSDEGPGVYPWRLAILVGVVLFAGITGGVSMVFVIAAVVFMIFLHELGHYLAARWGGMKSTEFFIGFGPRLWSFRRGETEYGIKAIPAGAYVKVIGMSNLDPVPPEDESRTYRQATFPRRFAVAVAGSASHFLQAVIVLFVLYAFIGIPGGRLGPLEDWRVYEVIEGTAADEAGLEVGDRIVAADGRTIGAWEDLKDILAQPVGTPVELVVVRGDQRLDLTAVLGSRGDGSDTGLLGIRPDPITSTDGIGESVVHAGRDFGMLTSETIGFIGDFFTPSGLSQYADRVADGDAEPEPVPGGSGTGSGSAVDDDAGRIISIVGAVRLGADLTDTGLVGFLIFYANINVTIGIINLIPLLPLDGGHVVIAVYERIREIRRGRRYFADVMKMVPVAYAVIALMLVLGLTSIYLDLVDPIRV